METMHFAEEVVPPESLVDEIKADDVKIDKRQLDLAQSLIDSLTTEFTPAKYENTYRKKVLDLVERKAEGKQVITEPEAPVSVKTADLLGALEKSLAMAKTRAAKPKAAKPVAHARKRDA
jgi:DNA end-binding protein Ku